MKKIFLSALMLTIFNHAYADDDDFSYGCNIKEQELQKQLEYAERYNNPFRQEALKRAIINVRTNCGNTPQTTDEIKVDNKLYSEMLKDKISKYNYKIEDEKRQLNKAEQRGKQNKISKRKEKISEYQTQLDFYTKELEKLSK